MSILSKYSIDEIKQLSLEEYMREATYEDIVNSTHVSFRVAALIRESTTHKEQLKAFEIQKDILLEFVESKENFVLSESNIFEEKGKSGLIADKRPAFNLMLRKAGQRQFDILVVDAVSRLARNLKELLIVIDDLRELGIGILILKERYWTFNITHNDVVRLAIDGGLAQAESMQTGKRVREHMSKVATSGQLLGGDMFGYRLVKAVERKDNTLCQVPEEAYVVRTIFERFASDNSEEVLTSSSLCKYLIANNLKTFNGDLNWTPPKVIRILENTKYMGYQLPGKSKVIDTVKKKKVNTHIEPIRDEYDAEGNLVKKGNLVKGNWEPIVSEELWWKAYERRATRSSKNSPNIRGRKSGLRVSSDAFGRKIFCSCGYCLSRQYTHAAKENRPAQYRYSCRWQIMYANKYVKEATLKEKGVICDNPAVSEMKLWLQSVYVFEYMFKNGKEAVLKTLKLIEECRQEEEVLEGGMSLQGLQSEKDTLTTRLKNFINMRADGEMTSEEYKVARLGVDKRLAEIDNIIAKCELEMGKKQKKLFDLQEIKDRLDTYIDLSGYKVSSEMIDMFVERIIYRGNDEFLWVMNLTGDTADTSAKYRISSYSKEYSDFLKDDKNFNIVYNGIIPVEVCQRYCERKLKRRFIPKYWRAITLKIAIQ